MEKFYKTTITIEVLSDRPTTGMSLEQMLSEGLNGEFSLDVKSEESVEVDASTMKKLLVNQRSDPDFFFLDEDEDDAE